MRTGILLQSCDETMGGIGVYTLEIVRALLRVDRENEYVLIYPEFGAASRRMGQFRGHDNVVEVATRSTRFPVQSVWRQASRLAPPVMPRVRAMLPIETYWDQVVVPKVAQQYGVDVLFNPHLTIPLRGRFGKVAIMHAVEYHTVPDVYNLRMYTWWYLLERFILPSADRLISISDTMTDAVRQHVKYPIDQVRTIYHGVSDKFHVETDAARLAAARVKYQVPERFILFVGRLYPEKNFGALARAFGRLKNDIPHDIVVVGQPRYKYKKDLELLRELGIEDRVRFLDYVPNDELPLIYNLADCFVNPSLFEAFGLAQIEAMASGCPVIAANTGAIPEITGDAAILFDPHDFEALSRAMVSVTSDADVRRDLVTRGLRRAGEFTWDRAARATLKVFEELA